MAELLDASLFPPTLDTCLEDTLADDDFLRLLQDSDLTGVLPVIPDVCQQALTSAGPGCQSDSGHPFLSDPAAVFTVSTPAVAPAAVVNFDIQQMPAVAPSSNNGHLCSSNLLQQQLLVQPQQPQRAVSSSGSDISAAVAGPVRGSAPSSPISSSPASSCGAPHQSVIDARCSVDTDSRPRQSSTGAVAASQQSQLQPQKPLTKQQIAANKRKAPEVDWRSIEDPAERRRQRRLAKNRVTAARSRERKKEQMAEMEERMATLEQENSQMRALLLSMAQENTSLKEQLASLTSGASTTNNPVSSPEPAALKCLAIMHLVCCLLVVKASFMMVAALVSVLTQQAVFCLTSVSTAASSNSRPAALSASEKQPRSIHGRAPNVVSGLQMQQHLCCVSCGA